MIRYVIIAFLVFVYTCCWGQRLLTLEDAQEILLKNNINIQQSKLQQKIAKINLEQAYDAITPNIGFSTNNQHTMGLNFDQITGQLVTGNQWTNVVNTNISSGVVLFQGFKGINTIRANKLQVEIAELDTEKLKHELQIQLLTLYFQTLINYDLHQASLEQIELSEQQLRQEETKIEVGKSTLVDLAQARNKIANDALNITNTKNAYDLSLLKLKQLLEFDSEMNIILVAPMSKPETDLLSKYHIETDVDPYIQLLNKRIDLSHINTKLSKTGYYPTISFNSSYGTNYSSRRFASAFSSKVMPLWDQMNQNRSLYLGLSLSYALYDKFTTKANVKKSQIQTENLSLERDKVLRERKQNIEQARLEHAASLEEQKAVQTAYETNQINYDAMNQRYNVGKSSSIDLFKAMTDLNIAQFRTIMSKYNMMLKAELLKLQTKR